MVFLIKFFVRFLKMGVLKNIILVMKCINVSCMNLFYWGYLMIEEKVKLFFYFINDKLIFILMERF